MHPGMQSTTNTDLLLTAQDKPLAKIPMSGISLYECLCLIPGFSDVMGFYGGRNNFVRSSVTRNTYSDNEMQKYQGPPTVDVVIHPAEAHLFEQWQDAIIFRNPLCDSINFLEGGGGGILRINIDHLPWDAAEVPACTNINDEMIVFWPGENCLNEFGYIYIGLHILGNFSRYFPDLWMKAVEDSHPIATVAERFLETAEVRLPLAVLSELSRTYHVIKS
jgi:hypothetical protein